MVTDQITFFYKVSKASGPANARNHGDAKFCGSVAQGGLEISTCFKVQAELLSANPINMSSLGRKWAKH